MADQRHAEFRALIESATRAVHDEDRWTGARNRIFDWAATGLRNPAAGRHSVVRSGHVARVGEITDTCDGCRR
jgi:hypothetical protein